MRYNSIHRLSSGRQTAPNIPVYTHPTHISSTPKPTYLIRPSASTPGHLSPEQAQRHHHHHHRRLPSPPTRAFPDLVWTPPLTFPSTNHSISHRVPLTHSSIPTSRVLSTSVRGYREVTGWVSSDDRVPLCGMEWFNVIKLESSIFVLG